MARAQQDILVKIKVLLEGLGNVRALAGHIKELNSGGGGQTAALAGNIDRLALAVDRLANASAKSEKSRGGFVRFLVGISAVVNTLATLPQAFEGLNKLIDFLDSIGGGIGAAFGKVKAAASSLFSSVSQAASGVASQAGAAFSSLGGAAGGLGAALSAALPFVLAIGAALAIVIGALAAAAVGFLGLAASVGVGALALTQIAQIGLQVQRQLEQVRLGIAAVITSLAGMKVDSIPVAGAEKFRVAMGLAADQLKKLQVDAINTTATFGQIAPAFQAAIAPGLAAGLTLDQIRGVTVKIVQAAGAIGLPLEQVNQEVRAILEGTINEDARLAKVLGISNKMVASWKAQGTLAEELNKRLAGFAIAGEEAAQTMDGLTSNLQEALDVFSTQATAGAFDALKEEFKRLLPQLFDFKSAGLQAQFKSLASLADDVLTRLVRVAGAIAQDIVGALRRAAGFVEQNRALIDDVLNLTGLIFRQLWQILGVFRNLATDTGVWRGALEGVRGILVVISAILDPILQKLREAEPLLRLAAFAATVLITSHPAMAGLGGVGGQRQEGPTGFSSVRLNPDGSLKSKVDLSVPRSPGGGGGKGGGSACKSKVPELQRGLDRATIDAELAEVQARFALIRQDIAASISAIQDGLDDAILSISDAYRLEAALADKALRAEQDRIDAEVTAAKKRRDLAVKDLDPDLKPAEKRLAIAAEDKKLAAEITRLEGERKRLIEETADKQQALVRDEGLAQKQLSDSLREVEMQLDSMSRSASVRADAAAQEIEARFEETRRQLVTNFGEASEQVKALDKLISNLGQRATFQELAGNVEAKFAELRDLEELLSVGVESGQIKARDATRRRLELEREYKRVLLDEISGLAEIARRTGDPALLEAVRKLQIEWSKLGVVINETAKRIDDTIRRGLEDTLANIITRTESVGDAFRKLAQSILAEIARILAVNFVEKLFGGILNTGGGNSVGNILSGILGSGTPKPSGGAKPAGSGIENLPLIIKNFSGSVSQGFNLNRTTTEGMRQDLRGGFGQVQSGFGTTISLLGEMVSFAAAQAAAAAAAAAFNIAKLFASGASASATGSFQTAAPGGRLIRVAEAGFDEVILTTDPKHTGRTSRLLGQFLQRTGLTPDFGAAVLEGVVSGVPSFAAGGFALSGVEPPEQIGGDVYNVNVNAPITTPNPSAFKQSEQQIKRDLARATLDGVRRAKSRPKN